MKLLRLLNNPTVRVASVQHFKKKLETNNRAYNMNQKTIQALDTLAKEYGVFEVTMKKGDVEYEGRCALCGGIRGG